MDWSELQLSAASLANVRDELGIKRPEDVLALSRGADQLLSRVLTANEMAFLREKVRTVTSTTKDSSRFALGARLGTAPVQPTFASRFVDQRDELIKRLDDADTDAQRSALEEQLKDLYTRNA